MHWLIEKFSDYAQADAWAQGGRVHSYGQLQKKVYDYSAKLRQEGITSQKVVAIVGDYSFDSAAAFLALLDNGNVIVPIAGQVDEQVQARLQASYVDCILSWPDGSLKLAHRDGGSKHELIRALQGERRAGLVLFSSGSTGSPKVMIHDLNRLADSYRGRKARRLTMLIFLLFDHIGGLNTLFNVLSSGSMAVIPTRRDPNEICALVQEHKVNILPSSPTFLNLVLLSGAYKQYDLSSLRMITYGTEAMPDGLLQKLRTVLPKVKFLQTFGTSETGIAHTQSKSSDSLLIKIKDSNLEYRIVEGELWLRSQTQVLGYLNSQEQAKGFTRDGWFKTGDLVEEDGEGYLKIVGRSREVINVGGQKVLPLEVESVLMAMPEVADCLVYGQANPITGQTVVAEIVSKDKMDRRRMMQLIRQFCATRLEPYKIPSRVKLAEAIDPGDRFKKKRPSATLNS